MEKDELDKLIKETTKPGLERCIVLQITLYNFLEMNGGKWALEELVKRNEKSWDKCLRESAKVWRKYEKEENDKDGSNYINFPRMKHGK